VQRVISISERGQLRKPREIQVWIFSGVLQNQFSEARYISCSCSLVAIRTDYNIVHVESLVFVPVVNCLCHNCKTYAATSDLFFANEEWLENAQNIVCFVLLV
jgi:hypothetical protein